MGNATPQFFDATQYEISQGGGATHPVGKFPGQCSGAGVKPTRDNDGHMLVIELTSQAGTIEKRYNLWNNSQQAVDIAQKELAALCYATGVFKLDMNNQGREFVGRPLQFEVRKQANNDKYHEVSRVFDVNGNEPSKNGGGQQQQPQGQPPQGQAPQGQPPANGGAQWQPGNQGPQGGQQQPAPNNQPPAQQQQPWQPGNQGGQGGSAPWNK